MKWSFEEPELMTVTAASLSQDTMKIPIAKLGRPKLNGDHYGIKFQRRDVRSAGENIRVELKMEALVETDSTAASQ